MVSKTDFGLKQSAVENWQDYISVGLEAIIHKKVFNEELTAITQSYRFKVWNSNAISSDIILAQG